MSTLFPLLAGLSIERLRTFCMVAEAGSIVAASRDDATRQSQYSRQIKELEEAVGDKLFHREGKKLLLTEAGRKLALATQGYFGAIEEIRAFAANESILIRLGAAESVFRWIVLPKFQGIMAGNPSLRFEFHTMRTLQTVEQVEDGQLDIGIVRSDAVEKPLTGIPIGAMEFRWVIPRDLLPEKNASGIKLIKALPIALLAGDGKLAKAVMEVAEQNQIKLTVKIYADSFGLIIESLQCGNLAAVLPAPAAATLSKDRFATIELPGMERLRRDLSLVYHEKTAAIRSSIKRMADIFARNLGSSG